MVASNSPQPIPVKETRRRLRELQDLAWERAIAPDLKNLEEKFRLWKLGKVSARSLAQEINCFCYGPDREVSKYIYGHNQNNESLIGNIALFVSRGLVEVGEVPEEVRDEVVKLCEFYRLASGKK